MKPLRQQHIGASGPSPSDVLIAAAWMGLVAGLVEGAGMLLSQQTGPTRYVSAEALWLAPLANLFVFAAVGALLLVVMRAWPRARTPWLFVFPLSFLVFSSWLEVVGLSNHLSLYAIALLALGLASAVTRGFAARERTMLRVGRRTLPWLAAASVLAFIGVRGADMLAKARIEASQPADVGNRPNVLVLVLDALRADHLSSYGYARATSPNLDRLAAEGVLYEQAFSTSPWSLPAHASLLAGRRPSELGISWHDPDALEEGAEPVLPEVLRSIGYHTAAFSANVFWVTHERFGRGFTHFDDYYASPADVLFRMNLGRAFERVVLRRLGVEDIPARRHATDMNDALLRWIDRHRDRPFFAMVNYFDVHDPYLPPPEFMARFAPDTEPPGILNWRVGRSDPELTVAELEAEVDAYDGSIAYLDDAIGRLREALEARGLLDNTVIVAVSDHGESFGEHGWYLHGHSLYREQLHVPLIVRWPERVPAGVRVARPVSIDDLPAVIQDLVDAPERFAASLPHSLLWTDPSAIPDGPVIVAETEQKPWAPEDSPAFESALSAVIGARWHVIVEDDGEVEVYQWRRDPAQTRDLAGSAEGAAAMTRLTRLTRLTRR